ncbi:hypothetical protein NLG97_g7425 [Lecanicillium saksenae]|uniref:Uncharacterized protein n=1 Tax=Lecanicillium saksenae TaxID=468837 RepID=A0ACC1QP68_9HYPO|nr:hypothetical protein NLG97_g7425 [Lecanicillium saksenae]
MAPRPPPPENRTLPPSSSVSVTQRIVQEPSRSTKTEPVRDDTDAKSADKGVAISRDQISVVLSKPSKIQPAARDDSHSVALLKWDRDVPPPPNKKKKLLAQSAEQPEEKLKKKKSKKKGKGDELSSLFGSL